MKLLLFFINFLTLFYLAYEDYKKQEIPILPPLLLTFINILYFCFSSNSFLPLFHTSLVLFLLFYLREIMFVFLEKDPFPEGDLITASFIASFLGPEKTFYTIFLASVFSLIFALIFKRRAFPFVPFLFVASILSLFLDKFFSKIIFTN